MSLHYLPNQCNTLKSLLQSHTLILLLFPPALPTTEFLLNVKNELVFVSLYVCLCVCVCVCVCWCVCVCVCVVVVVVGCVFFCGCSPPGFLSPLAGKNPPPPSCLCV